MFGGNNRGNYTTNNSSNQGFENNTRFFPTLSSSVAYRSELIPNETGTPQSASNTPSTPTNSRERHQLALNEGMFYVRPDSFPQLLSLEETNSIVLSPGISRTPQSSPVSPHQQVIADALGFSSHSRVYQLSATNHNSGHGNKSLEFAGPLATSPSSKDVRKYLASRPNTAPSSLRKQVIKLTKPDHNLEAPGLKDDFYCNVVSWSPQTNRIAVGLNKSVYSWSTDNDVILMHHDSYISVTAVSYSNHDYIVIGKDNGEILLISQKENIVKATLSNQGKSIFCFQWFPSSNQFLAGDSKGDVLFVTIEEDSLGNVNLYLQSVLECHQQQICGNYYLYEYSTNYISITNMK